MNALHRPSPSSDSTPVWNDFIEQQKPELLRTSGHPAAAVAGAIRESRWEDTLLAPVREILARPGKAIRASLVQAGYALVRPGQTAPDAAIALVELLHAGSLIIDDIEDDSPVRRGGRALHRIFGVPTALNSANCMYFFAVEQIERLALAPEATLALHRRVNRTLLDCHRGQALDLGLRIGEVPRREIPTLVAEITLLKTGALTALAMAVGAVAAGGSAEQVECAEKFGRDLGLALQQLDDMGNLASKRTGKKRHEDLHHGRLTWPWAWAAETLDALSFARLEATATSVREARQGGRPNTTALAARLMEIAGPLRRHFVANQLRRSLAELRALFGEGDATMQLAAQARLLEESYV
jgi:geranylgeranyl pyrophosphate synthase